MRKTLRILLLISREMRGICKWYKLFNPCSNIQMFSSPSLLLLRVVVMTSVITLPRVDTTRTGPITSVELIKLQSHHFPASRKASFRSHEPVNTVAIAVTTPPAQLFFSRTSVFDPSEIHRFHHTFAHGKHAKKEKKNLYQDRSLETENKRVHVYSIRRVGGWRGESERKGWVAGERWEWGGCVHAHAPIYRSPVTRTGCTLLPQ